MCPSALANSRGRVSKTRSNRMGNTDGNGKGKRDGDATDVTASKVVANIEV